MYSSHCIWGHFGLTHLKDADGLANSVDSNRLLLSDQPSVGLHSLLRPICPNTQNFYSTILPILFIYFFL